MRNPTLLVAGALLFVAVPVRATVIPIAVSSEFEARSDGGTSVGSSANNVNYDRVGYRAAGSEVSDDLPFKLPTIPVGESITSAILTLSTAAQSSNKPLVNADLYGANAVTNTAPAATGEPYYYSGSTTDGDSSVTLLEANFLDPTNGSTAFNYTSSDISSFIEGLYSGGATAGQYVTLRLTYDSTTISPAQRYEIYKSGTGQTATGPTLTITTIAVPEPASLAFGAWGALGLMSRRRRV